MSPSDARSHLPLTHLTYHILVALADAPRHGYGIIKEVERGSGGAMSPSTGALYLALQRMQEEGLLEEAAERPPEQEDDARRKYYRLTGLGRRVASAESERLAAILGVAAAKRLVAEPGDA